jgi:predicted amidohydrolase
MRPSIHFRTAREERGLTDFSPSIFRLAVSQSAPRLGDLSWNTALIRTAAETQSADLLLTPELSLTGYDVRHRVHDLALPVARLASSLDLPAQGAVAVGYIELGAELVPYNAAAIVRAGEILFQHRKVYLPTYGMFDEGRYFGRGETVRSFEIDGWRFGLLICEDFWHPALSYLLACQGIDVLLVMAAAPGRGAWLGGETSDFASSDVWLRMARTIAQQYGIYVAHCNRVGVEGGVTFGGGSVIVQPNGDALHVLQGEETTTVQLSRLELQRARRPYAHIRDESPELVLRELQRIVSRA